MSKVFIAVIAFIVSFALFLMFNTILPQFVFSSLTNAANTTLDGATSGAINLKDQYNHFLWVVFPRIFGLFSIFTAIAIPIAYFLDTHRFESESYTYDPTYNDNQYLR